VFFIVVIIDETKIKMTNWSRNGQQKFHGWNTKLKWISRIKIIYKSQNSLQESKQITRVERKIAILVFFRLIKQKKYAEMAFFLKMLAVTIILRHCVVCNRLQPSFIKKQKL
jgi:hypothetical protein